ncbi:hypothetical protein [Cytophaga sp. FL35]|uniref:hypothetical protein n=1 Tax=Cytophaga sp. FL35 TaxID=1904456 RepID=UPI00165342AE|nr:hypothetical protein [Cytophaga sp. FL35]MBC7000729.1 hypothetical protein [Cytophaga sp. FL35]
MTKTDVLDKELSNAYALTKQINNLFENFDHSFLEKRTKSALTAYLDWNQKNERRFSDSSRELGINPGNTIDSVAKEMLENIGELDNGKLSKSVKNLSFKLCLNRLLSYHKANMENIQELLGSQ